MPYHVVAPWVVVSGTAFLVVLAGFVGFLVYRGCAARGPRWAAALAGLVLALGVAAYGHLRSKNGFHKLTARDTVWELQLRPLTTTATVAEADVADLALEPDVTGRLRRLVVTTRDGTRYTSAAGTARRVVAIHAELTARLAR